MKCLALILSLLLAVLASCTRPAQPMPAPEAPQHDTLAAFDTLMQSQPDSALYALLDFKDNHKNLTPFDRHYADLLLSEALFKNDYEQTLRTEVQQAQTYFDSLAANYPKNDDFTLLSARLHYMNGVGLMEADSVVEACTEYLKALEIMEEHFDEKDLVGQKAKFMALTYNRLGNMFSDQLITEQALACFKSSLYFSQRQPTSKYGLQKTMATICNHYNMLNQPDSALYYLDMAEKTIADTNNIVYRDILTSKAILLYDLNGDANEAMGILSKVSKTVESDNEKAAREFVKSEMFYKEGMLDSAQTCLEFVFNSDIDILPKIQAAKYLQEIYTQKGETAKASFYRDFLAPLAVESYEQKNKDSHLVQLFQDYQQKFLQNKQKKEVKSLVSKGVVVLCLVLLAIPFIIVVLKRRHRKVLNVAKSEFEQKQTQHNISIKRMQNNNARLREENSKLIAERSPRQDNKLNICNYESMLREPVIFNLMNRLSKVDIITTNSSSDYVHLSLSPKDENKINLVVEKYCQGFTNKIATMYPNLGKAELRVCKFFLIGLTEPQIAVLIQNEFGSLWKKGRSIKEKMGCSDIHLHLKSIIFDI